MKRKNIINWIKTNLKKVIIGTLVAITVGGLIVPASEVIPKFELNENNVTYFSNSNQHKEKKIIAIEAGHGADLKTLKGDPGAMATDGKCEAERTMELTKILKNKLEKKGYKVILVRDGNYEMSLGAKQRRINEIKPDLSLSIHFNSAKNPVATGTEVLANKKSLEIYGEDFAMDMAKSISKKQGIPNRGVVHVGEDKGERRLYTRSNRINSANLLLEICFTSNSEEVKNYDSIRYLVAQGIADTIEKYVK